MARCSRETEGLVATSANFSLNMELTSYLGTSGRSRLSVPRPLPLPLEVLEVTTANGPSYLTTNNISVTTLIQIAFIVSPSRV